MGKWSRLFERWLERTLNWKVMIFLFFLPALVNFFRVPASFRGTVMGSVFNAEAFQFRWVERGLPFWSSYFLSASIGTYELLLWWTVLILYVRKLIRREADLPMRYQALRAYIAQSEWPLLHDAHSVGEKIYYFFVPRRTDSLHHARELRSYVPLVYYGGVPGGEWTGLCYALEFKLYLLVALPILAAANMMKIFLFGGLGVLLVRTFPVFQHHSLLVVIGIVILPLARKLTERSLKGLNVKFNVRPAVAGITEAPPT